MERRLRPTIFSGLGWVDNSSTRVSFLDGNYRNDPAAEDASIPDISFIPLHLIREGCFVVRLPIYLVIFGDLHGCLDRLDPWLLYRRFQERALMLVAVYSRIADD